MKLLRNSLLVALLIMLYSCNKESIKYSCNPKIDEFVTNHLEVFSSITWDTLHTYPEDTAIAIYNSLSIPIKKNIWIDKFDFMIANDSLSIDEIAFLQNIQNEIVNSTFDVNDEYSFVPFTNSIVLRAQELGWSNYTLGVVFASFHTISTIPSAIAGTRDCDCKYDAPNRCLVACGYYSDCDGSIGCGWFLLEVCNGICQ